MSDSRSRLMVLLCTVSIVFSVPTAWAQDKPKDTTTERKEEKRPKIRPGGPAKIPRVIPPKLTETAPPPPAATPEPVAPSPAPGAIDGAEDADLYRCKRFPPNARIKVTLKPETELKDLVTWVMGFTCRSFIFGTGIMGRSSKVTIIAPTEMSPSDAYRLFLVALQTMNLTVVPKGRTLEIIESPRAREAPLPVFSEEGVPSSDQIVRALIRPEHISVEDTNAILNALKSKDGVVMPFPSAGAVMVTDAGSSIARMREVLRDVDQPAGGEKIFIVKVRYSDATELAQKMTEILGVSGKGGPPGAAPAIRARTKVNQTSAMPQVAGFEGELVMPSKIISDQRTNSIIIVASERAYQRILALIRRLDIAVEGGEGTIHVYPLANATAEELAGTISSLISGQPAPRKGAPGMPSPAGAPPSGMVFEGAVRVTADKPTNSLVIVSSVKDFLSLREVIRKLDKARRQVFIEASILELNVSKSRQIGLSYHGGADINGDAVLFGAVQNKPLTSLGLDISALSGLAAGIRGKEIPNSKQIIGVSIPSFGVMFQLLANNEDANVISTPHILTTDNEAAEIAIGKNIPFKSATTLPGLPTGAAGAAAGLLNLSQPIQRQDVALKIKLTPHVNESGLVRLELEQELSDVDQRDFEGLGPSWSKKTVKTTIVVKDQQPVVIGGLVSDRINIVEAKVPLLGDIPILGYLFKSQTKSKVKANLLIFLTPYVIQEQADLRRIFEKKMKERREFIETFTAFKDRVFMPDVDYTKKRGIIEEINKAVKEAEEEARLIKEAEAEQIRFEHEGPVDLPQEMKPGGQTPTPGEQVPPGYPQPGYPPTDYPPSTVE
ncbi:MAG: type II secretion system secretin GspD [Deltaproteobacteria bacterium]|nr:type II secretion system secretin GspD [Deltaproteobacteria bacterium]